MSGCRSTAAICLTTSKRRLASSSFSISSVKLNFSMILRARVEKPDINFTRLGASLSGSPRSLRKVKSLVLWKVILNFGLLNFRLIIFSMVSASYLPAAFSFLCSATTLSLVSSSTQSSRRSTVSGIITRRYCGGR